MNNTKLPVSLEDTTKLRKLIVDNPDLPLIVFCGDDCWYEIVVVLKNLHYITTGG